MLHLELACLRHLRELKADHNQIVSIAGLKDLDGLTKLSLRGNLLEVIDLKATRWTRLEALNLSGNRISRITGVEQLSSLICLVLGASPSSTASAKLLRLSVCR